MEKPFLSNKIIGLKMLPVCNRQDLVCNRQRLVCNRQNSVCNRQCIFLVEAVIHRILPGTFVFYTPAFLGLKNDTNIGL